MQTSDPKNTQVLRYPGAQAGTLELGFPGVRYTSAVVEEGKVGWRSQVERKGSQQLRSQR